MCAVVVVGVAFAAVIGLQLYFADLLEARVDVL